MMRRLIATHARDWELTGRQTPPHLSPRTNYRAEALTSWLPIPHTFHRWPGSRIAGVVVRRRGRAGIR
jgi:hypothetical protein